MSMGTLKDKQIFGGAYVNYHCEDVKAAVKEFRDLYITNCENKIITRLSEFDEIFGEFE